MLGLKERSRRMRLSEGFVIRCIGNVWFKTGTKDEDCYLGGGLDSWGVLLRVFKLSGDQEGSGAGHFLQLPSFMSFSTWGPAR